VEARRAHLAPPARWQEFEAAHNHLGPRRFAALSRDLRNVGRIFHGGDGPYPIPSDLFEVYFARSLRGERIPGKQGYDAHAARTGWQLKVLNNRTAVPPCVLTRISSEPTGSAQKQAETLIAELGRRLAATRQRYGLEDSRICFLFGKCRTHELLLWEEPFYPEEVDLSLLDWSRPAASLQGRDRQTGAVVFDWYPSGGQLRYAPVPQPEARSIVLPSQTLSAEQFSAAIDWALSEPKSLEARHS
jgi:hypothetical protein